MRDIEHVFGPGETVKGIIRKFNGVTVPGEIMELLCERFAEINPMDRVPRVGERYKIPVYKENGATPITNELSLPKPVDETLEEPVKKLIKELAKEPLPLATEEKPIITPNVQEEEDTEMKPHKDDVKAMLDRQRRRELARGEKPKEYKVKQLEEEAPTQPPIEQPVEETKEPVEVKKEEQPKPRKKRKIVNPMPKKAETKEVDEAEQLENFRKNHAKPRVIQSNYRDLRKRRH